MNKFSIERLIELGLDKEEAEKLYNADLHLYEPQESACHGSSDDKKIPCKMCNKIHDISQLDFDAENIMAVAISFRNELNKMLEKHGTISSHSTAQFMCAVIFHVIASSSYTTRENKDDPISALKQKKINAEVNRNILGKMQGYMQEYINEFC